MIMSTPPPPSSGVNKGVGTATLFASFFLGYALAFWYGTKLVADDLEAGCESDCASGVSESRRPIARNKQTKKKNGIFSPALVFQRWFVVCRLLWC